MKLPHELRAFRHRSFRLFFLGQGVSQFGTWLQLIATSWLIYRLTGSAFYLGLASFALQIPFLVLAPMAGVWVDRLPKRTVLRTTNSIAFAQSKTPSAILERNLSCNNLSDNFSLKGVRTPFRKTADEIIRFEEKTNINNSWGQQFWRRCSGKNCGYIAVI